MDRRGTIDSSGEASARETRLSFMAKANDRLNKLVARSRAALFLERFWRAIFPAIIVVCIFVGFSLIGGWLLLPAWARLLGLCGFALALVWSGRDLFVLRWPSREDALSRIEKTTGQVHRPLTAVEDTLVSGEDDPATRALWELHKKRMAAALASMRAGPPNPKAYRL
ncbi:MAG: DUF4175 family protein, partial [Roseibium sp.]